MKNARLFLDNVVRWFSYTVLTMTVFILLVALFTKDTAGEAKIGSFSSTSFNEGWTLEKDGQTIQIKLPYVVDAKDGDILILKNTLPAYVADGSSLLTRATMQDIYIYVNGRIKQQYSTESGKNLSYYLPSAYVVTSLNSGDSGKEIQIKIRVKATGSLHGIWLSHGNNVWFDILKRNLPVTIIATLVFILGTLLLCFSATIGKRVFHSTTSFYLSLVMIDIAIWAISESGVRQLIFAKPSLSQFFSYSALELIPVLTCMFFDSAQHWRHHKSYLTAEICAAMVLLACFLLHFTGTIELYRTLIFAHGTMLIGLLLAAINFIRDLISGEIREYKSIAIGTLVFLVDAVLEIGSFYYTKFHVFGIYICIGLIALMITTLIQSLMDQLGKVRQREEKQSQVIVNTIETIAGAIDANDEYTGGHSERVGLYAGILARAVAADFDLSEEDIERIEYIGRLHDIGKIGVADFVLNKAGKLNDTEFSLMKKHVEIGADLIAALDDSVEGLVDGIKYHHERFDGKGYPDGLFETDIPLVARILCLADCYDAMTSNRIYRNRLTDEEVRAEIIRCSGTQFDPYLAEVFVSLMDRGEIHPLTFNGMETSKEGDILKSSQLEFYLQQLIYTDGVKIENPSHVRMLCYLIKLMEKKHSQADVLFISSSTDDSTTQTLLISLLNSKDMIINIYDNVYILAVFNRKSADIDNIISALENADGIEIIRRI